MIILPELCISFYFLLAILYTCYLCIYIYYKINKKIKKKYIYIYIIINNNNYYYTDYVIGEYGLRKRGIPSLYPRLTV